MNRFVITAAVLFASMLLSSHACATVVEHQGDRIVINVDQMEDLKGDESLLDIINMTMPEVMTTDGRTTYDNSLYGFWAIRIDNINVNIDPESFLKNTKARDLKKVKLCMNPGVIKGCGNMKKVIDCNFRSIENGTSGTVNVEGGTYGNASTYNTIVYQRDNLNIMGWAVGNLTHEKAYGSGIHGHGAREDAKMQMKWNMGKDDLLELNFNQTANRNRVESAPLATSQYAKMDFIYMHSFTDDGAYGCLQGGADYLNSHSLTGGHDHETDPFLVVEFSLPFINHNLWLTPGIEMGYTGATDMLGNVTNRSKYEDYYMQVDWALKKFHLMFGDRFRSLNYWNNNDEFEHSWSNHYYTVSAWYNFNEHNTLQGMFAHRFFSPFNSTFNLTDEEGNITGYDADNVYKPDCYVTEMRYTYQKKGFILTSLLQNVRQDFDRGARSCSGHDNTLSAGFTANWKVGVLRLVAGANYNWERYNNTAKGTIKHNNFVTLRFLPEVVTDNGWRFLATMLYNSRSSNDVSFPYYTMANFYAALRVSKDITPHWNVYADMHDLADQRTGNREALLGVTYKW